MIYIFIQKNIYSEYIFKEIYSFFCEVVKMNYDYQNEVDFINLFNDKYYYKLDNNSQKSMKKNST